MKKTILAFAIAATAMMVSCGKKAAEEVEVNEVPVEEAPPVQEEAPAEEVVVDSTAVSE